MGQVISARGTKIEMDPGKGVGYVCVTGNHLRPVAAQRREQALCCAGSACCGRAWPLVAVVTRVKALVPWVMFGERHRKKSVVKIRQ